jgi:galactokinase
MTMAEESTTTRELITRGMSPHEASSKADMFAQTDAAIAHWNPAQDEPQHLFVPGRLEFLGKHTDYAGGRSLICPVERGFCLSFTPRNDQMLRVRAVETGQESLIPLSTDATATSWGVYVATVARRATANFGSSLRGADIAFRSDLPQASGLSSSSALLVSMFLILDKVNNLSARPEYRANIHNIQDLAGYLGTNENGQTFGTLAGERGVGTFGGSEDHTAIVCGRPGFLSLYSFRPVVLERQIPFPQGYTIAIGNSGVTAEKANGAKLKYNALSARVAALQNVWEQATGKAIPSLAAVIAGKPEAADELRKFVRAKPRTDFSPESLITRLDQFQTESEVIIPAAADAISHGNIEKLGSLVEQSQAGAEQRLENQVPETIALARSARQLGAIAASAFGAGFGGSVWAMVKTNDAEQFLQRWQNNFMASYPSHRAPAFFVTRPGPAACFLES